MPRYLYRTKATRHGMLVEQTEQEARIVAAHFDYLKAHADRGAVLMAGRTQNVDEDSFGIVIFEAESEDEARAFMVNDPAVIGGVMEAEVFPYRVAIGGHVDEG
jgi:uncharacterized protein YciI